MVWVSEFCKQLFMLTDFVNAIAPFLGGGVKFINSKCPEEESCVDIIAF